jgi:hypothetical protein
LIEATAQQRTVLVRIKQEVLRDRLDARRRLEALVARYESGQIDSDTFNAKATEINVGLALCKQYAEAEVSGVLCGYLLQRDQFDK